MLLNHIVKQLIHLIANWRIYNKFKKLS